MLFLVPHESNVGYALDPLIRCFVEVVARSNGGADGFAHLGFNDLTVPPTAVPAAFDNLLCFDPLDTDAAGRRTLSAYIRQHRIELVMLLDEQPASSLVRLLRDAGVRCVLSYWGAPISGPQNPLRRLFNRLRLRLAGQSRVDGLIFESRAYAGIATTEAGCWDGLIDLCPTGVDLARFVPAADPAPIRETFGIAPDKTLFVFSGHAQARKGIGTLIDAAIELAGRRGRDDFAVLICGDRHGQAELWRKRSAGTRADAAIHYAGYRADLPQILLQADVGVIPSSGWDSFPMSSLEMQAAAIPVIGSRLGGLPETLAEGDTGLLVAPGDPIDLAGAMARLIDDPEERRRLGANGRARIAQGFTLAHQQARMTEIVAARLSAAAGG